MKSLFTTYIYPILYFSLLLISCNDDDDSVGAPIYFEPQISLSEQSGSFGVGQVITIDAELEASGLIENLTVSAESTILASQDYQATGEESFRLSVQVPASWLGNTQSIVFTLTDMQGQVSSESFEATISEKEPQYTIEDVTINGTNFKQITGNVNFDETLGNSNIWLLNGSVKVDQQTTLTIEEGTTIYALTADSELDINIGGDIIAEGTLEAPIIFTSFNNAPGQSGTPSAGDWIGVTLRGDNMPDDNSGILKYVRIEYGGNGDDALQLRQVGNLTTIDLVQVHDANSTGIRIRGGAVNLKHIVVTKPDSRCVRYGGGWNGNGQFWALATSSGSRAINGTDENLTPQSNPIISNATVIGAGITETTLDVGEGVRMQDGANGQYYNTVISGFGTSFRVRDGGEITMRNCAVFNNDDTGDSDGLHSSIRDQYREAANNNSEDPFSITDTFVGVSMTNSVDASTLGTFFDNVNYVGAVPVDNDWTVGWTRNFNGSIKE